VPSPQRDRSLYGLLNLVAVESRRQELTFVDHAGQAGIARAFLQFVRPDSNDDWISRRTAADLNRISTKVATRRSKSEHA